MGEQEPMTAQHDDLDAGPVTGPAGGGPGVVRGGPLGWFRRRSLATRLAILVSTAIVAIVVTLLALGTVTSGPSRTAAPAPRAPGFSLAVLGHPGQHRTLSQYAGHPLIINFFASWCAPCQRETPLIARFYQAAHGSVTVLGVDVNDSARSALKFAHRAGVAYPVVTDPQPMTTTLTYGVPGLPATFFLNSQHRIVKRVYGAVNLPDLRTGMALMTKPAGRS